MRFLVGALNLSHLLLKERRESPLEKETFTTRRPTDRSLARFLLARSRWNNRRTFGFDLDGCFVARARQKARSPTRRLAAADDDDDGELGKQWTAAVDRLASCGRCQMNVRPNRSVKEYYVLAAPHTSGFQLGKPRSNNLFYCRYHHETSFLRIMSYGYW